MEKGEQKAFWERAIRLASSALIPDANALAIFRSPEPKTIPIQEVMPTVCIQGYEATGQTRVVGDRKRQLHRFIGDVCWGLLNVFDPELSRKEDRGDPFEAPKSWWQRLFGG
jgi:hypothetical protein